MARVSATAGGAIITESFDRTTDPPTDVPAFNQQVRDANIPAVVVKPAAVGNQP